AAWSCGALPLLGSLYTTGASHHRQRKYSRPLLGCQRLASLREIFQAPRYQGRPAGLVTRPQAAPGLAMEIFMEQHQVTPVRVSGKTRVVTMAGAAAVRVREKEPGQACGEVTRYLLQIHPAS